MAEVKVQFLNYRSLIIIFINVLCYFLDILETFCLFGLGVLCPLVLAITIGIRFIMFRFFACPFDVVMESTDVDSIEFFIRFFMIVDPLLF